MSEDSRQHSVEELHVMTKEDVHDYGGVTLNENGTEEERQDTSEQHTYIKFHTIGIKAIPWWKKILFSAVAVVFVALVVMAFWFFFLGVGLFFIVAAIVYMIIRLLKRVF